MIQMGVEKEKPCCGEVVEIDQQLYEDYKALIEDNKPNVVKCRDCRDQYDVRKMVDHYHICIWNR